MSFEHPELLWLVAVIAVLGTGLHLFQEVRRHKIMEKLMERGRMDQLVRGRSPWRRGLKAGLYLAALGSCAIALASPTRPGKSVWRERGIDIVVAVDASRSMAARDVYPSRYERAALELQSAIGELDSVRLGAVAFAGNSIHLPLSRDWRAVLSVFDELHLGDLVGGSNLDLGLKHAHCLLGTGTSGEDCQRLLGRRDGGEPLSGEPWPAMRVAARDTDGAKVVVLVSDGGEGSVDATAVSTWAAEGIELIVLGVGSTEGSYVPSVDDRGEELGRMLDERGAELRSRLQRESLEELANAAQGRYLELSGGRFDREAMVRELRSIEQGELDDVVISRRRSVFDSFVLLGLGCLFLLSFVGEGPRRSTGEGHED